MTTRQQKISRQQERRAAEDIGGFVQKGSGNNWAAKGDVRLPTKLRVECKTTERKSFRVELDTLLKIRKEALKGMDDDWVMQLQFRKKLGMSSEFAIFEWGTARRLGFGTYDTSAHLFPHGKGMGLYEETLEQVFSHRRALVLQWPTTTDRPYLFGVVRWNEYLAASLMYDDEERENYQRLKTKFSEETP